jgi:uncharacterized protein
MSTITIELVAAIKKYYPLSWMGIHGVLHWNRVYENGMKLSEQEGVDKDVVQLFSVFHDSQRHNEGRDGEHGMRGGLLAGKLREYFSLDDDQLDLLITACQLHTHTQDHDNITVQACFDSDRLDLGRVGISPDPALLCTPLAKSQVAIQWASAKSQIHKLPERPFGLSGY